jgi:hypothetical protein
MTKKQPDSIHHPALVHGEAAAAKQTAYDVILGY